MADDDTTKALLAWLTGRTLAHDLLLRGLWTLRVLEKPDPEQALFENIEGMIGSLNRMQMEPEFREAAEQHLRDFAENLAMRLGNLRAAGSAQDARDAAGAAE